MYSTSPHALTVLKPEILGLDGITAFCPKTLRTARGERLSCSLAPDYFPRRCVQRDTHTGLQSKTLVALYDVTPGMRWLQEGCGTAMFSFSVVSGPPSSACRWCQNCRVQHVGGVRTTKFSMSVVSELSCSACRWCQDHQVQHVGGVRTVVFSM